MTLETLIGDLFRMPDQCPECMVNGNLPVAWNRPDTHTLNTAYTCTSCKGEWVHTQWEGKSR